MIREHLQRSGRPLAPSWALGTAAGALWLFSLALFLFGLLAPLTPSEGYPTALALVLFAGLPLALCFACVVLSRNVVIRVFTIAQALFIVGMMAWLLSLQGGIVY
jgi:hypothetical protein